MKNFLVEKFDPKFDRIHIQLETN